MSFQLNFYRNLWICIFTLCYLQALPYNQLRFCPNALWNTTAQTFADNATIGSYPYDIFIDRNNTIYVTAQERNDIFIWNNGIKNLSKTLTNGLETTGSIFVNENNDIYVVDGYTIEIWKKNAINATSIIDTAGCFDIFINTQNILYCSQSNYHQIITQSLNNTGSTVTPIAGTGCIGNLPDMFYYPTGIYVDTNSDLYVADTNNHRIQLFRSRQKNATTLAGVKALGTISLYHPQAVLVDANKFLFIVDTYNHRIIRSNPYGFQCILGCNGGSSSSSGLLYPYSMAFDTHGNIFVVDSSNNRIQKFTLSRNICNATTINQQTSTTIMLTTTPTPIVSKSNSPSYNRPRFTSEMTWSSNGIMFANTEPFYGYEPRTIFIDKNDTIYATGTYDLDVHIWYKGNNSFISKNLYPNWMYSLSLFVTNTGDIYSSVSDVYNKIYQCKSNASINTLFNYVISLCTDLFIDNNNTLYCSASSANEVLAQSLNSASSNLITVAGTGCTYFTSVTLDYPCGIFVDNNFNLYVADYGNSRIQLFRRGQRNATTVAGAGASNTIDLYYPIDVVLDDEGYLFIIDYFNHRIVKSGPNGFRCIISCFNFGTTNNQLWYPSKMAFDSNGHIFVIDNYNYRIQKFTTISNSCNITATSTLSTVTTMSTIQSNNSLSYFQTNMPSYNQPKFQSGSSWNVNGTSLIRTNTYDSGFYDIFITINNTIYVTQRTSSRILVWFEGDTSFSQTIYSNRSHSYGLFVTDFGDIYVDNGYVNKSIDKWTINATTSIPAMYIDGVCFSLFVDIANNLYCALTDYHTVVAKSLNNQSSTPTTIVGLGCSGSHSNMLNKPYGIFVDTNYDLYVADCENNRIQLFGKGETNGITVAGNRKSGAFLLKCPTDVTLDADKYLFIVDSGNHRIIGSHSNGFRCIVGCSNYSGSEDNQLNYPISMAFDKYGNIFVTDQVNSRIQQFTLIREPVVETTTNVATSKEVQTTTITSTVHQTTFIDGTTSSTQELVPSTTQSITSTMHQTTFIDGTTSSTQELVLSTTQSITSTVHQTTFIDGTTSSTQELVTSTEQTTISTMHQSTHITQFSTSTNKQMTTSIELLSTSNRPYMNQSCYSPNIEIIPGESSLASPVQFQRSQDFSIVSIIDLNCEQSLSTIIKWTIYNCSTICTPYTSSNQQIRTTFSELYIPARSLPYGIYQLQLNVTMTYSPIFTTIIFVYIQIKSSLIAVNPIQSGTSSITNGFDQDLQLDPGSFSLDFDEDYFNKSNWKYEYYCRIYGISMFPTMNGSLLSIDDPRSNPSCLSNRTGWIFGDTIKSSLKLFPQSLQSNRTYQFIVSMENRYDSQRQANGSVLVTIEDTQPIIIVIGCVIWTMCIPDSEYQRINPTTQVALYSISLYHTKVIRNIIWNVYFGEINSSTNTTIWRVFEQMNIYENSLFFGRNTSNFTTSDRLFSENSQVNLWRFEVIYFFDLQTSTSALNFMINQPPRNGSCLIEPLDGTIETEFTISCLNWFDEDGIKSYIVYFWTTDPSKQMMIAYSFASIFRLRLPAGDNSTQLIHLHISIEDSLNSNTEINISSVRVTINLNTMNQLINEINNASKNLNRNSFIKLLASQNQNQIGQTIISLSQQLDLSYDISFYNMSVSPLGKSNIQTLINESILNEYKKLLNYYATVREYLMTYMIFLPITTFESIQLQSGVLVELTKSTNQLTRASLNNVSERCYQLCIALQSISKQIANEKMQIVAKQLIQCASNVLTAVNGPLQERMMILDLDISRSVISPDDYDTDIESSWFDYSSDTTTKNRNNFYQKQLANQIAKQMNELISNLTTFLSLHINIGQNITMNTSEVFMFMESISIKSLLNKQIRLIDSAYVHFPSSFNISSNPRTYIQTILMPLAPFGNSNISFNTNQSNLLSISISDQNRNEIPIEIVIPRDDNFILPAMIRENVTSNSHQQIFNLHYVNISNLLSMSIHVQIHSLNEEICYLLIYKFDGIPQLNSSISVIDGWTILCKNNSTYFIDNKQIVNHRSLVFGVREVNSTEVENKHAKMFNLQLITFTSDYMLRVYASGCYYLNSNNEWQSDGLTVDHLTNQNQTQCYSTHLKSTAGGFLILPTPINWSYVFANADFLRNKTIYSTVIIVCVVYLFLLIFARRMDKKDIEQLGVTLLSDNHPSDEYYYQILVFTGHRKDAGTKSRVHFIISGDWDQTKVRTFDNPYRKIFQRGGIDGFVMSVRQCLGPLNYVHIWHDNSGKSSSASWFLKYLIIRDLQTMKTFYFICQQWFAVEKDDEKIERVLMVANESEQHHLSHLFNKKAFQNLSDGHLWFSIFFRPIANSFTRVQRCTCCFVLLFLSMFLNIMYYGQLEQIKLTTKYSLSFGSVLINYQEIIIGIILELVALIPSLLLIQLFRRLEPRHKQTSHRKEIKFAWWWIFIGYGFCILIVGVSILFILARGIEFGDIKSQQWLVSIVSGFCSSIFLTQPLKVLCLTIFFICLSRKSNSDNEVNDCFTDYKVNLNPLKTNLLFLSRRNHRINRLTKHEIMYAREQRLKEIQMWMIIREAWISICFLLSLFLITYSNQDQHAFLQVNHLRRYFRQTHVTTINDYWKWLDESFITNLRAQRWYNNDPPRHLAGFLNDKSQRLIGWAIIRQLRIHSHLCPTRYFNMSCHFDYSSSTEDHQSYAYGWKNQSLLSSSIIARAFQYRSSDKLDTNVYIGEHGQYKGGGYIYECRGRLSELRSNLSELHRLKWIDHRTRAIIIQLTLYNPNVDLFTSVTLLTEFLSTGGLVSHSQFEPIYFYDKISFLSFGLCIVVYIIIIIYFICKEFYSLFRLKWKYFLEFESWIQLAIIICSWLAVYIYIRRYHECSRINELFRRTNGYIYINVQLSTYVNDLLNYIYGFCCFFGTLTLLRFCRYSQHLSLFSQTLNRARNELISFSFMFTIVFMAFICLFYFLFQSTSTLTSTIYQMFEMILMKFDARELIDGSSFLGPFAFVLFILFVVFICLNIFISIINEHFRYHRTQITNDQEIFSFMFSRFQCWMGWKKSTNEERDTLMRNEYMNVAELLPQRIDELFDKLNKLHLFQNDNNIEQI